MQNSILEFKNLSVAYSSAKKAIEDVSATIAENSVTAIMGPSGCGKSTLLRAINRMHDLYQNIRISGEVLLRGESIFRMDAMTVRRRAGMVFQRPNPFPAMSIYDNVLAGYKLNGVKLRQAEKNEIVEQSLRRVAMWDEVKDALAKKGSYLSGGQQQRLCIARTIAMQPEILLMDEPTSALDPISTKHIEDLILELKQHYSIIIVTHNMNQAARISDHSMFMYLGRLVEYADTKQMFTKPKDKRTEEYLRGVFG
ncbi:MAG: phosphate ABC transporter ATP-binding protein PstB [Prevotella sp.]|jgi:phosphate transport system ATP-binding protein|nr:phosphate ABC transporter ATP-binding protein PstB [Prevotella sp.]